MWCIFHSLDNFGRIIISVFANRQQSASKFAGEKEKKEQTQRHKLLKQFEQSYSSIWRKMFFHFAEMKIFRNRRQQTEIYNWFISIIHQRSVRRHYFSILTKNVLTLFTTNPNIRYTHQPSNKISNYAIRRSVSGLVCVAGIL